MRGILGLAPASVLLRLDGHDARRCSAPRCAGCRSWSDCAARRDYHLLDREVVKLARMHAPDRVSTHPESGMTRTLYECKHIPLTPAGPEVRLVVATHATTSASPTIGVERDGMVYELFVSTLPALAFTASDVLDLYLHRGSFEAVRASEDVEQDSDRWYSHTRLSPGVLSDPRTMDLEPADGTGADTLLFSPMHHRICPSI